MDKESWQKLLRKATAYAGLSSVMMKVLNINIS
jgi:hypothetical protein